MRDFLVHEENGGISVLETRNFSEGQGNQGILRRRTFSTPHNQIPQIDPRGICSAFHRAGAEIAKKGRFKSEIIWS
jgi:hypothetical protein